MFASAAFAQDAAAALPQQNPLMSLLPLLLVCVVFYFLLIRPQQKKFKEHQSMIAAIKRGDKVVTGGGIIGTVTKVQEEGDILHVEIAPNVQVQVARQTVTSLATKPTPANDAKPVKASKAAKTDGSTANDN